MLSYEYKYDSEIIHNINPQKRSLFFFSVHVFFIPKFGFPPPPAASRSRPYPVHMPHHALLFGSPGDLFAVKPAESELEDTPEHSGCLKPAISTVPFDFLIYARPQKPRRRFITAVENTRPTAAPIALSGVSGDHLPPPPLS